MPVRSLQIVHARNVAVGVVNVFYTVPAGQTLLVKDWRITNVTAAPVDMNLLVRRAGISVSIDRRVVAAATTHIGGGFVALEPGDELCGVVAGTVGSVIDNAWLVSGAALQGVA